MRRALLTALTLLLAVPAAADAAGVVVVRGRGFGHGGGMSQYGAYGFAQHGFGYRQILAHYYTGTSIASVGSQRVRVLLQPVDPYIRVRGATRLAAASGSARLRPTVTYVARPSGGGVVVRSSSGRRVGRFSSPVRLYRRGHVLRLLGPAQNGVTGGLYRGTIEVWRDGSGVTAVNVLAIDPYVQGVVPGEMPSSWSLEALKAQAVAARSYALAGGAGLLYADTRSQMYRGVAGEAPSTNEAVRETHGEILTYGGAPIAAYYHSTSGGHTENIENVFSGGQPRPYLRGVDDPYDDISPWHSWRVTFSARRFARLLRGYFRGRYRKVRVLTRGVSPRILTARVYGSRGSRLITGPALRARLRLRDTWARFTQISTVPVSGSSVRAARWGVDPLRQLSGVFDPAPRGRLLAVERRSGRGWRRVALIRTSAHGRYEAAVSLAGVYRVRAGDLAGPAVRVR